MFTCPNRAAHANGDNIPSAGFVPNTEKTVWNCFSCGNSSDIFGAYAFLEGVEIRGANWYNAVKTLADRYSIHYEVEPLSAEEQIHANIQQFLQELTKLAHKNLLQNTSSKVWDYLKKRKWGEVVNYFSLGYLEETPENKKFFEHWFGTHPEIVSYIAITPSQLYGRLLCPIKHKYGVILGVTTRRISDNDNEAKYIKHFLKTVKKGGVLFNLNKKYKTVYLVEGASSVFTFYNYGIHNVVSMLGKIFSHEMYNTLIKNGVDRIIFCFDGDEPGLEGLYSALNFTQDKFDIKVLVKSLPKDKDPDDIINEFGVDFFKGIPEVSNFKYQLIRLKNSLEDSDSYNNLKKSVFDIILSCKDLLIQDKMIVMFLSEFKVSKTSLSEELIRHRNTKGLSLDVGVADILSEESHLINNIGAFEEKALRCGKLKGISTGFPLLDEALDGLQQGLILVAGKWNTGKTAFLHSLATNLLPNASNFVLYFSIDDAVIGTTIPRLVSNLSMVPISIVSNPIHRIDKNETIEEAEKLVLKQKRNEAIDLLKTYSGRFGIKDSVDGYDTSFIEKMIKIYRSIAGSRNLIILVDFLNMVEWKKKADRTEIETQLAFFFKQMSNIYDCPVVCTVEATKGIADSKIKETDIKGSSALQFRSTLTLLLSSDFEVEEKSNMYWYNDKGVAQPIVKVRVSKNKGSSFRRSLYYKFQRDCSKFIECTEQEQHEFSRAI